MDEILCNMRKQCIAELAGMLKEVGKGTMKELTRILSRFCIQEGRTMRKTRDYLHVLEGAGLISFKKGDKTWKYNPENEWELFNVGI